MSERPTIAIAMGDAGGIGPELILKVLAQSRADSRPLVVGDAAVMRRAAALVPDAPPLQAVDVADLESATGVPLLEPPGLGVADIPWGRSDVRGGAAAGACLTYAFGLAGRGLVDGVVNAPMSKETFHEAGYTQMDELEYLA